MSSQADHSGGSITWDRINSWTYVLPPSRPNLYQLSFIRRWLGKHERSTPVGVLGSTPEFVDLLIELGFRDITVFEKFPAAYDRMRVFRVHSLVENVVWGDWLQTLPQNRGRFTALLSDLTSGNIAYSIRPEFCNAVRNALHLGGVFIDRVLTGRSAPFKYEEHIKSFLEEPINLLTANRFNCEIFFSSTLSEPEGVIDTTAFYDQIIKYSKSARLTKLLTLVEKVTPKGCVWWYGKPWNELAPSYFLKYNILETVPEPHYSWYADAAQLHLLKRQA